MHKLHRALLLEKLYLLQSCGFSYCDPQFLAPKTIGFKKENEQDFKKIVESCKLCDKKGASNFGLCNKNSKMAFVSLMPILDGQLRFAGNMAQMLKNIIEKVFFLKINEVSILSLLKCEIPLNAQNASVEQCSGYFLKQLEMCGAKILVILGGDVYAYLTQDGSHYNKVQGKVLQWNQITIFPTFSLGVLMRDVRLKAVAHRELLLLKEFMERENA
ncbi:MAG: uracil-DNA glycosylase family protein [Helicobacter sp.]|nr:uracil-DNA glycosylase family protein [Helicobacteraceae bacterium]MDY3112709.1 uracil-DNA glycosylase family protein [Helicobacter sp.]